MKTIQVVAAIIKQDHLLLATQRGYGEFQGGWEFPGGKIEPNETHEEALIREIQEELNVSISVDQFVHTVNYDYPTFHLTMHCYLCTIVSGTLTLVEHNAARWLSKEELDCVNWLPADIDIVTVLKNIV